MLSHFARMHEESIRLLQNAERAIEAAFTVSITQEIATLFINDNMRDYPGEDYEDIWAFPKTLNKWIVNASKRQDKVQPKKAQKQLLNILLGAVNI